MAPTVFFLARSPEAPSTTMVVFSLSSIELKDGNCQHLRPHHNVSPANRTVRNSRLMLSLVMSSARMPISLWWGKVGTYAAAVDSMATAVGGSNETRLQQKSAGKHTKPTSSRKNWVGSGGRKKIRGRGCEGRGAGQQAGRFYDDDAAERSSLRAHCGGGGQVFYCVATV